MSALSPRHLRVLRALSVDCFTSGETLAQRLGCTRATVHNAVRDGMRAGLPVQVVRGRGYRIARPVTWLDAPSLQDALAARGMIGEFHAHLDSTNSHLLARAQAGAPHRTLVCAEWQSDGRGRRGRVWLAGLGTALTFSLLWRSRHAVAGLAGLSLAVGVSLRRALAAQGVRNVMVKWPNDLVVGEAKLAGVLIELSGDMLGPSSAVIGVGINVCAGADLAQRLGRSVTDVSTHLGSVADRGALLLALAEALDDGLAEFEAHGFAAFRAEWESAHAYQGRAVQVCGADARCVAGRAVGVDDYGALMLDTGAEIRRFHAGELSLQGGLD